MNFFDMMLKTSLGSSFVDIPFNQCPRLSCVIELNFRMENPIELSIQDETLPFIRGLLGDCVKAIAENSTDKWEFFNPLLFYKPDSKTFTVKLFAKDKEKLIEDDPNVNKS